MSSENNTSPTGPSTQSDKMATTPPRQIRSEVYTPLTPLHGATYDEESPQRRSTRLRQKREATQSETEHSLSAPKLRPARTPNSPRPNSSNPVFEVHSPDRTPQRKSTQRVQVMSPASPNLLPSSPLSPPMQAASSTHLQPFLSSTTTLSNGMLPTPVKTPRKKNISKSSLAPRALFQDLGAADQMAPSPKKSRTNKRFNGFSLESFRAEDASDRGQIQIFTDSRDQVPEADDNDNNPFLEPTRRGTRSDKVTGTAKRRKISEPRPKDAQVEKAIRDDDGLVYVFRGKKIFRRFDDSGEEEEEIDAEDLGLLQHNLDDAQPVESLRTLTRKSIRPTRLFQTEAQKRARELEKEEEAATDVETIDRNGKNTERKTLRPQTRRAHLAAATSDQLELNEETVNPDESSNVSHVIGQVDKKSSPFDSWPRIKRGSAGSHSAARATRSRKRAAGEMEEAGVNV